MLALKVSEIVEAANGILVCGDPDYIISRFNTDSRKIEKGDFFIPISGDNFDGHNFIDTALQSGACGYLTSKEEIKSEAIVIRVKDTLKAYQDIAGFYRDKFNIPIVAVTGSCGKTSTKEMIFKALSEKYKLLKTEGNLNNHIGLPKTLLNLDSNHETAVVEMGMSGLGEISILSRIARPQIAVITNIGVAHIGKLGSQDNILKAKLEILEGLAPQGVLVLNGDDELLFNAKDDIKYKTITYGLKEGMDIQGLNPRKNGNENTEFDIIIDNKKYTIEVSVPGFHNVYNALAAIAVGMQLEVDIENIVKGIRDFKTDKMRMNVIKLENGTKIINDVYNANPNSMEEALKVLEEMNSKRKIAVLGDMLELGDMAIPAHESIGSSVCKKNIDMLITVGESSKFIAKQALRSGMSAEKVAQFNIAEEAKRYVSDIIREDDAVLIKGSRGMKMEIITNYLAGGDF